MHNMDHASIWEADLTHPAMGAPLCFTTSRLMSVEEFKVPPPKIASQLHVRRAASDPSKGEISGNNKILSASPTLSGASHCKIIDFIEKVVNN